MDSFAVVDSIYTKLLIMAKVVTISTCIYLAMPSDAVFLVNVSGASTCMRSKILRA